MEQVPGTISKHEKGLVTVGFLGQYYATCKKAVSFAQIEVREGTCKSTATGYWSNWDKKTHDPSPEWDALASLTAGKGYKWDTEDEIYTAKKDPVGTLAAGTFSWPIPSMYRKKI